MSEEEWDKVSFSSKDRHFLNSIINVVNVYSAGPPTSKCPKRFLAKREQRLMLMLMAGT
jgi:hypothetical protein